MDLVHMYEKKSVGRKQSGNDSTSTRYLLYIYLLLLYIFSWKNDKGRNGRAIAGLVTVVEGLLKMMFDFACCFRLCLCTGRSPSFFGELHLRVYALAIY